MLNIRPSDTHSLKLSSFRCIWAGGGGRVEELKTISYDLGSVLRGSGSDLELHGPACPCISKASPVQALDHELQGFAVYIVPQDLCN